MRTTKQELRSVTDKVYCDGCNACCSNDNFGHDYAELDAYWGYNSTLDGTKYDIQLCENCFKDVIQLLQTKRKLWSKTDGNNPLYGELKYHVEKKWPSDPRLEALQKLSDLDQELGLE